MMIGRLEVPVDEAKGVDGKSTTLSPRPVSSTYDYEVIYSAVKKSL
jgi:hypothetical protein